LLAAPPSREQQPSVMADLDRADIVRHAVFGFAGSSCDAINW
jgi:hypothetical protein